MATITVTDVPDDIVDIFGSTIDYSIGVKFPKGKKRLEPKIDLNAIYNDPNNTSYGPFDNTKDFLESLKS